MEPVARQGVQVDRVPGVAQHQEGVQAAAVHVSTNAVQANWEVVHKPLENALLVV